MNAMITLSKGGTGERKVKLETLEIPDLWGNLPKLKLEVRNEIVECWHLTHDLKRALLEAEETKADLLQALDYAKELIPVARQYFPKSIRNPDKFQLENTCATIGKAIHNAESK